MQILIGFILVTIFRSRFLAFLDSKIDSRAASNPVPSNWIQFDFSAHLIRQALPRDEIWKNVAGLRFKLLLATAVGLGTATVLSDFVVLAIYDRRYLEVGWMVPLLLAGVWVTALAWIAEYVLLGVGKPSYAVVANVGKLALLIICLSNVLGSLPIVAVVSVVAFSDLPKYCVFLVALRRERLSFLRQDAYATIAFIAAAFVVTVIRWVLGFGTVFERFP